MNRIKEDMIVFLQSMLRIGVFEDRRLARVARRCLGNLSSPKQTASISESMNLDAMRNVVGHLAGEAIDYCLVGGLAVANYVSQRVTMDIDIVVATDDIQRVRGEFPGGMDGPVVYSLKVNGVDVDFIKTDSMPWVDDAIRHANIVDIGGVYMRVARPEYLILFKLFVLRERDESDIIQLLRADIGLYERARKLVKQYLPEFLDDLKSLDDMASLGM